MILQLKYMLTVMNPARIASSDWKSYKCYGLWYALSSKRVRWPPIFFYVFNLILSFSACSQSFNKICTWEVLGANVLKSLFFSLFCSASLLEFFPNDSSVSCMTVIQTKPGNLLTVLNSIDKTILLECRPSLWTWELVRMFQNGGQAYRCRKNLLDYLVSRKADQRKFKV